jgi:hypothetical protein
MTRLTWGDVGSREYETGVDRGVLFVGTDPGVAWNGITEIEESPSGGDARPFYIDGVKYLNEAAMEEFEATISAFYSPAEFDACDGTLNFPRGLSATQQRRKSFGLSYRTKIGNDVDGTLHGYKIHIVYNALAQPVQRKYTTLGKDPSAEPISWSITTRPVVMPGARRVSHVFIDSTEAPERLIQAIEDILYGTDEAPSRIPSPTELVNMFNSLTDLIAHFIEDGSLFTSEGASVTLLADGLISIEHENVVDNGDGTFTITAIDNIEAFELGVAGPGEYKSRGSGLVDATPVAGEFTMTADTIVDNGDGTFTIQQTP